MTEVKGENLGINLNIGAAPAAKTEVKAEAKPADKGGFWWGTGRRKTSVARVRIKLGSGKLLINDKELNAFFTKVQDRDSVMAPLASVNSEKTFDVFANVNGGGTSGQAGAIRLGIARALKNYNPDYLSALRDAGHLTRDSRMVERKKPGRPGARRRFQFSKR